jgi:hypothetical protein
MVYDQADWDNLTPTNGRRQPSSDLLVKTTMSDVLREIRDLADYLLADNAEMRRLSSDRDYGALMGTLEALRVRAGSVALERQLDKSWQQLPPLPVARPGSAASNVIDIAEWQADRPLFSQ